MARILSEEEFVGGAPAVPNRNVPGDTLKPVGIPSGELLAEIERSDLPEDLKQRARQASVEPTKLELAPGAQAAPVTPAKPPTKRVMSEAEFVGGTPTGLLPGSGTGKLGSLEDLPLIGGLFKPTAPSAPQPTLLEPGKASPEAGSDPGGQGFSAKFRPLESLRADNIFQQLQRGAVRSVDQAVRAGAGHLVTPIATLQKDPNFQELVGTLVDEAKADPGGMGAELLNYMVAHPEVLVAGGAPGRLGQAVVGAGANIYLGAAEARSRGEPYTASRGAFDATLGAVLGGVLPGRKARETSQKIRDRIRKTEEVGQSVEDVLREEGVPPEKAHEAGVKAHEEWINDLAAQEAARRAPAEKFLQGPTKRADIAEERALAKARLGAEREAVEAQQVSLDEADAVQQANRLTAAMPIRRFSQEGASVMDPTVPVKQPLEVGVELGTAEAARAVPSFERTAEQVLAINRANVLAREAFEKAGGLARVWSKDPRMQAAIGLGMGLEAYEMGWLEDQDLAGLGLAGAALTTKGKSSKALEPLLAPRGTDGFFITPEGRPVSIRNMRGLWNEERSAPYNAPRHQAIVETLIKPQGEVEANQIAMMREYGLINKISLSDDSIYFIAPKEAGDVRQVAQAVNRHVQDLIKAGKVPPNVRVGLEYEGKDYPGDSFKKLLGTAGAVGIGAVAWDQLSDEQKQLIGAGGLAMAVKPKGGMWHPEAARRLADAVFPSTPRFGGEQFRPASIGAISSAWALDRVTKYLNRYAGTSDDPLKDIVLPSGKRWEEVTDKSLYGASMVGPRGSETVWTFPSGLKDLKDAVDLRYTQQNFPDEPHARSAGVRYVQDARRSQEELTSYLSHVGDYLRQNVPPEQLPRYDLVRAVRETAAHDEKVARQAAKDFENVSEQRARDQQSLPTYKSYGEVDLPARDFELNQVGSKRQLVKKRLPAERVVLEWKELAVPKELTPEQARGVRPTVDLPRAEREPMRLSPGEDFVAVDAAGRPIKDNFSGQPALGRTPQEAWLAGQLAQEGNLMGHCVGGYCAGVVAGESRILSLRDSKGRSYATVEVAPRARRVTHTEDGIPQRGFEGQPGLDILQIKGPGNGPPPREVLPYVQDFVKSGKWGEVRDLENAGLKHLKPIVDAWERMLDPRGKERAKLLRERFGSDEYVGTEEFQAFEQDIQVPRGPRGERGSVDPKLLRRLALGSSIMAGMAYLYNYPEDADKLAALGVLGMMKPARAAISKGVDFMERTGGTPEEIWKRLRAYRGSDGIVREEIPDSAATLRYNPSKTPESKLPSTIGEALNHPKLFEEFPDLAAIQLKHEPLGGKFGETDIDAQGNYVITVARDTPTTTRKFLLHELQHVIQEKTGMSPGGHIGEGDYWNLPGEVEARDVEKRSKLSEEQLAARLPAGARRERGSIDPGLLMRLGALGLGGYIGAQYSKDNPLLGAGVGAMAVLAAGRAPRLLKQLADLRGDALKGADYGLGMISTRLRNISEALRFRAVEMERRILSDTHAYLKRTEPFLLALNKVKGDLADQLSRAILTNDEPAVINLIRQIGDKDLARGWVDTRKALIELGTALQEKGRFKDLRPGYFPRIVTDRKGLLEALGRELRPELERRLVDAETVAIKAGKGGLTQIEESLIINRFLAENLPKGGLPGFAKGRKVKTVTEQLEPFYATPTESLHTYIRGAITDLEKARFFGKNLVNKTKKGHTYIDEDSSIGNVVREELDAGRITADQATELRDILKARFHAQASAGIAQDFRNAAYAGLLGNFISASVQFGDAAVAVYAHGLRPTLSAVARSMTRRKMVDMRDFGLADLISEEFVSTRTSAKFLNAAFKVGAFSFVDRFGKNVQLNAALSKHRRWAQSAQGVERLREKFGSAFDDREFGKFVQDLQQRRIGNEVKLALFSELSDVQPISKLEATQFYLENPKLLIPGVDARTLLMLKNYSLKMLDIARRDGYNEIKRGNISRGLAKLTKLGIVLGVSGATTQQVQNWLLGRDSELRASNVLENAVKTFGWSEYAREKFSQGKPLEAVAMTVAPPYKMFDDIVRADPKAIRYIPPIGRWFYDVEMGGAEKWEESRRQKEARERRREQESGGKPPVR